jgi:integrative and conjugative element protein (TIGR02256 family)
VIFRRPRGGHVKLDDSVVRVFDHHRQTGDRHAEAGGILRGRFIVGSCDIVVDGVTIPSVADRRGRFFFWRAREPAQRQVDRDWAESANSLLYLGEWHTHPERTPVPSILDRREWRRILRDTECDYHTLLFAIVGQESTLLWEGNRRTGTIELLTLDIEKG